jgi:hypothetical protein
MFWQKVPKKSRRLFFFRQRSFRSYSGFFLPSVRCAHPRRLVVYKLSVQCISPGAWVL